jgi:heat shock protein HslJ
VEAGAALEDRTANSESEPKATQIKKAKGKEPQKETAKKQESKKEETKKEDKNFPLKTPWIYSPTNGKSYGVDRPTLILDENYRATGFSGCNTYSATAYPLRGYGFAVGPLALTKKACDKATMDQERTFLLMLRTSQAWDTVEGSLILKSPRGTLRFERSF